MRAMCDPKAIAWKYRPWLLLRLSLSLPSPGGLSSLPANDGLDRDVVCADSDRVYLKNATIFSGTHLTH